MILSKNRKFDSKIIKTLSYFLSIQSFGLAMSQTLIKHVENGEFGEAKNSKFHHFGSPNLPMEISK